MKKFFKKVLTSKITAGVLAGITLGALLMTVLSLAVPALAGALGASLGVLFGAGVAYGLTKYADFVISAKEGERLGGQDGGDATAELVQTEDFVVTAENDHSTTFTTEMVNPQVAALQRETKRREKIKEERKKEREKYSIELDEMGK